MMWRNKSISKLYAFALAAVFALTLAGCGGGGGGAADTPVSMPRDLHRPPGDVRGCRYDGLRITPTAPAPRPTDLSPGDD